jgi:hypothetical protein
MSEEEEVAQRTYLIDGHSLTKIVALLVYGLLIYSGKVSASDFWWVLLLFVF